jgi:hypothetical protein
MDSSASLEQLSMNLGCISGSMKAWERSTFGSVQRQLAQLRADLERKRKSSLHSGPSRKERRLMSSISELLSREEIMERQRS